MKKRIKRSTKLRICKSVDLNIEEITLKGEALKEFLIKNLSVELTENGLNQAKCLSQWIKDYENIDH